MNSETVKNRNGENQDFVDYCMTKIEAIEKSQYRKNKIEMIKESYRIYQQKEEKTDFPFPNAYNIILPLLTITNDNLEPRLVAGLTGKKPIVNFQMDDGLSRKDQTTELLEHWFNEELETVTSIETVAGTIVHKCLMEGTVFPVPEFNEIDVVRRDFQFIDKPVLNPQTGAPIIDPQTGQVDTTKEIVIDEETGNPVTVDIKNNIFRGVKVKYVSFSDVFIADDVEDWDSADTFYIVRPTYGELELKKNDPGYMNIGPWLLGEESDGYEKGQDDQSPGEEVNKVKITGNEVIDCYQCCVNYVKKAEDETKEDIQNWQSQRFIALITKETRTLIRLIPLVDINFKNQNPLRRIRLFSEKGMAYGSSMYEKIKAIQNGASTTFNMVLNSGVITMIPWFLYSDAAGVPEEAVIVPGKGIKVDDPSQVAFPRFAQNPGAYIRFIEMFMSLHEKLGSIGDIQVGKIKEGSSDVTATETITAVQQANVKHNYQSITLKADFISLIRIIYDMYYQYMPNNATFKKDGQEFPIPRAAMQRPYKFKLVGSTDMANSAIEMQKADSVYMSMRQDPVVNPLKLISDRIKSIYPEANPKEYIAPDLNKILTILQQFPELAQQIMQYPQQVQNQEAQEKQQMAAQEMQLRADQAQQAMQLKEAAHRQAMAAKVAKTQQEMAVRQAKANQDMILKAIGAKQNG